LSAQGPLEREGSRGLQGSMTRDHQRISSPGTQNCRHCGDPIDGPPLTPSCPGPHSKHLEE
jgi:hypothetical protein